jgi:BlaI family transcriptional regulator, penicillinase repressor
MPPSRAAAARDLTPAQLELLDIVWKRGEVSVAEVWHELGRRRPLARNTVQTMLTRLLERGWLRTRAQGNALYYSPARKRASVLGRLLGRLIDTAFDGSSGELVATLIETRGLDAAEIARIERLIAKAKQARR